MLRIYSCGMFISVLCFGLSNGFQNPGEGGLKFHSQRIRNPLTSFGGIHGKAWGRSLGLGPSDPGLDCDKALETGLDLGLVIRDWIVVKPKR